MDYEKELMRFESPAPRAPRQETPARKPAAPRQETPARKPAAPRQETPARRPEPPRQETAPRAETADTLANAGRGTAAPGAPRTPQERAERAAEMRARRRQRENRKFQKLKIAVTVLALAVMTLVAFALPLRPKESETEKRKLAEFPKLTFASLADGSYFAAVGTWFSDTVPFRDKLTSLNARMQHLLGSGGAQAGFNEGVRGDEIPDVPMTDSPAPGGTLPPAETAAPVDMPTAELPATDAAPTDPTPYVPAGPEPAFEQLGGVLISGNAGFEYYNFVRSTADKYIAAVNRAASVLSGKAQVYTMVIPTSMDITLDPRVREKISSTDDQQKAIAYIESQFAQNVRRAPIFAAMTAHRGEYIYYRTDHHWTGLGAYYAYVEFCRAKGAEPVSLAACTRRDFSGFLGTFYNDSGQNPALGNAPDVVETFTPPGNPTLKVYDNSGNVTYSGGVIYDESSAPAAYKYGAFIFGDNALSVIENPGASSNESCLLVKESFGNAIAPLLCANYKYVYVMDYRHCSKTVAQLVDQYKINDVLFANNISMTRSASLVDQMAAKIG